MVVQDRHVHGSLVPVIVLAAMILSERVLNAIASIELPLIYKLPVIDYGLDAKCCGFLGTILVLHLLIMERHC